MPLDRFLDHRLRYVEGNEDSEYEWCIQELDESGEQVGPDWTPSDSLLSFRVCNARYVNLTQYSNDVAATEEATVAAYVRESIEAELIPDVSHKTYSMMGCKRDVEKLELNIIKSEVYEGAFCFSRLKFRYDQWSQKIAPDYIEFLIYLTPEEFDPISLLIKDQNLGDFLAVFQDVEGFYTSSTGDGVTKVLSEPEDHQLKLRGSREKKVLWTGGIGNYRGGIDKYWIRVGTKNFSLEKERDAFESYEYDCDETEENNGDEVGVEVETATALTADINPNEKLEQLISKLRWPLWLIFATLVLIAFRL